MITGEGLHWLGWLLNVLSKDQAVLGLQLVQAVEALPGIFLEKNAPHFQPAESKSAF